MPSASCAAYSLAGAGLSPVLLGEGVLRPECGVRRSASVLWSFGVQVALLQTDRVQKSQTSQHVCLTVYLYDFCTTKQEGKWEQVLSKSGGPFLSVEGAVSGPKFGSEVV